jgi:hypothetical protein
MDFNEMRFCRPLGQARSADSNSPSQGSNPPAPARHCGVWSGFPGDVRMGRKSRLFAHSLSYLDGLSSKLRPQSLKVSGLFREYSRFAETVGGDWLITTAARGRQSVSPSDRTTPNHQERQKASVVRLWWWPSLCEVQPVRANLGGSLARCLIGQKQGSSTGRCERACGTGWQPRATPRTEARKRKLIHGRLRRYSAGRGTVTRTKRTVRTKPAKRSAATGVNGGFCNRSTSASASA